MKFLSYGKDGGPESRVWAFFFVEIKKLFTVSLIHFKDGSREAYHTHAFNAVSFLLKGSLMEYEVDENGNLTYVRKYSRRFRPIWTPRDRFHKVVSAGNTFVLSFRGRWANTWKEYLPLENRFQTLTHGRKVVDGVS